jgi:hypothetical protein
MHGVTESNDSTKSDGYDQEVLENSGKEQEDSKEGKKARVDKKKKQFAWQKAKGDIDAPIKNQQKRPGAEFELKQKRAYKDSNSLEAEQKAIDKKADGFEIQKGNKSKAGLIIPEAQKKTKNTFELNQSKVEKNNLTSQQQGSSADRSIRTDDESSAESARIKSTVAREIIPGKIKLTEQEDLFKQTVNKALKGSCEEPDTEVLIKIEETQQMGVIPIDSAKIHGYFLVGRGGIGFSLGTGFLDFLAESIEKELAAKGIDVQCQKPFLVETESFDFDQWAQTVENFTVFEQSGREEIALTFVPTRDRIPHLVDSEANPDMAKIEIEKLSTNIPVPFNSYIHLKKNDKFFLYLKTGNKILPRQKEMFQKQNNTRLHINKEDFAKFQKYVAEELVQTLIDQLRMNKRKSSDDEAA